MEDVRRGYVDDPLDSFERAGISPFTGRPVRENSDQSIEEIKIPRTYLRQPLDRAEYEANERRLRQPEGDSSSEDDEPIILRNRRPENRFPSYDPPPSPPALGGRRERWSRIRSPSPPIQRLRTRVIETRERAQPRRSLPSLEGPRRITRSLSPASIRRRFDITSDGRNEARIESIGNNSRLTERKAHVPSRSSSPPGVPVYDNPYSRQLPHQIITHHRYVDRGNYDSAGSGGSDTGDDAFYSSELNHPLPLLVNNSPPVLTGLGNWQNRKANLWTELNPTISKDNTMGEAARRTKMFAEFAKNRPSMFGEKVDLQISKEVPLYPSLSSSMERDLRGLRSRIQLRDDAPAAVASAAAVIGTSQYRERKAKEAERKLQRRREDRGGSFASWGKLSEPRRTVEEEDVLFGRIKNEQMAISRITPEYGLQRSGGIPDRFKQEAAPALSEGKFEDERLL